MAEKKYSVLAVLKVLQKYSDEEHPIQMKQIKYYVNQDHKIVISYKTIRSDITALKTFGFDIRNKGSFDRTIEHGDGTVLESKINKDWYLVGPISDQEIEILYDSLLSERYLSEALYSSLGKKLQSLSSSVDFDLNTKGAARVKRDWADSEILYNNMKILREAIVNKQVVSFYYAPIGTYGIPGLRRTERSYVSPRRVFNENGVYYLLGCDKYDQLVYLRIELIRNLQIEEWRAYSIYGMLGKGLTTNKELTARRFKKIPDEYIQIRFRFPKTMLTEAVDYFGSKSMAFKAVRHEDTHFMVSVTAPEKAMLKFAFMYAPDVEILAPKDLRSKVREVFSKAAELYKE